MTQRTDEHRPARQRRRRLRRALLGVLAGLVGLAVVVAGIGAWAVTRSFPQLDGRIDAAGIDSRVDVQRDARGIPTITADSSADLFFVQGFVHAQDRFWEMDFRRHLTSGRLSELFGESQRDTDVFLRTLGWHRVAEQEVEALPEEVRGYYEAYAEGVNAYLADRSGGRISLEYTVLGMQNPDYEPEPWTPADSVAWFKAMAWDLRTNIEDETARALESRSLSPERLAELYPGYPFDEHPVILADDRAGGAVIAASAGAPAVEEAGSGGEGLAEPGASASDPGGSASPQSESAQSAPADASAPAAESVLGRVDALISSQSEGVGSNSWVVSGEFTESGKPLLANDPHLGAEMPSVWTQMQLRCRSVDERCPFDVAGFSFSGLPGIVIGHNREVAWGFTNLTTDVADLYVERVEPDGYWKDGKKHPFETRRETIRVAGGSDEEIEVRSTAHGPIVSGLTPDFTAIAEHPRVGTASGGGGTAVDPSTLGALPPGEFAVSLRWTALDAGSTAEAIFLMNTASDYAGFREAASKFDVPAQNLIYADLDGNIGYQAPGRLPVRGAGDGWLPQPGWDSAYDWRGFVPFDEQPRTLNPASGYIVTANNAIVDDAYPYLLSRDWDYGYRAARIVELLEERIAAGPVDSADMTAIQLDNRFPAAAELQAAYASVLDPTGSHPEGVGGTDSVTASALRMLQEWDGQNDADSAAAAYANVLWEHVTAEMVQAIGGTDANGTAAIPRDDQGRFALFFARQLDDPESVWFGDDREALLLSAAEAASHELVEAQGSDPSRWNWGELHALELTNGTFGTSGIAPIEALFNRGPYPVGGGSSVVNATGWTLGEGYETVTVPSMRMVIDLDDWDASTWQNLSGQSGHAFHPNYADQAENWASGETYAWPYSRKAVEAATTHRLVIEPST
ncbi:penicillin acylase family protein [Leucobacter ruminantium]|uniref:Penicillin acylase family protein n=1 Tax=Leucobacter ruminantium TaxID=1289170 RepID=A0A939RT66_9MICO|nr:penicillin acylase family protein [Leucobacter ruminantium]MBO1803705.1 penicillin acylase family protein [Leucobacter ruminantium]